MTFLFTFTSDECYGTHFRRMPSALDWQWNIISEHLACVHIKFTHLCGLMTFAM